MRWIRLLAQQLRLYGVQERETAPDLRHRALPQGQPYILAAKRRLPTPE
ncbi:hypothetical protein [Paenibacillus ginsengihumi]|nr:hypothetical protein [Paenibacillus ginsengihumi]